MFYKVKLIGAVAERPTPDLKVVRSSPTRGRRARLM